MYNHAPPNHKNMAFTLKSRHNFNVSEEAERLDSVQLDEILQWCWDNFGDKAAIGTSFQGSGLVIIDHAIRNNCNFPIFTIDTGFLFPETLDLKKRLEDFW